MKHVLAIAILAMTLTACQPVNKDPDLIPDGDRTSTPYQWEEFCQYHGEGDPACK